MTRTTTAADLAKRIKQNADDGWDRVIPFDVFGERARALWDEAEALGIADDVREALR